MAAEPFEVSITEAEIADLRERLRRTRWPEPEPVDDWSQGLPLAYAQELCRSWTEDYDFGFAERLNVFPQYRDPLGQSTGWASTSCTSARRSRMRSRWWVRVGRNVLLDAATLAPVAETGGGRIGIIHGLYSGHAVGVLDSADDRLSLLEGAAIVADTGGKRVRRGCALGAARNCCRRWRHCRRSRCNGRRWRGSGSGSSHWRRLRCRRGTWTTAGSGCGGDWGRTALAAKDCR
jgi:hypothetical protein